MTKNWFCNACGKYSDTEYCGICGKDCDFADCIDFMHLIAGKPGNVCWCDCHNAEVAK